jgi:DNA-binding GntR family transcriptional regulator
MKCAESPSGEWLAGIVDEVRGSHGIDYRTLAGLLREAIAVGGVPVGGRLPAQRELAGLLGVGRNTVVGAYNLLRAEALVRPSQGAGTWVVGRPPQRRPCARTCA